MRQVAIVTGASRGLGAAIAQTLSLRNHFIVGVSRGGASSQTWRDLVASGNAMEVRGSVGYDATAGAAFECAELAGSLSVLINCAGVGAFGAVSAYTRGDVDHATEASLIGLILFSSRAFSLFRNSGGAIVNVMSIAALSARGGEALYCAAKWGARGFTEALQIEAKGTSASVIAVYPGGMTTEFWAASPFTDRPKPYYLDPADVAEIVCNNLPAGAQFPYTREIVIEPR